MTTRSIDQLLKLSMRIARIRLRDPCTNKHEATQMAILSVCEHLSQTAGFRSDIDQLVHLITSAVTSDESNSTVPISTQNFLPHPRKRK